MPTTMPTTLAINTAAARRRDLTNRRSNFEAHVAECSACNLGDHRDSGVPVIAPCAGGAIILAHYAAAIVAMAACQGEG